MNDAAHQPAILLIVDDEEGMRDTLTDILEEFDYAVHLAADGQEAVERVRKESYQLVLMDFNMPVMNGIEALRQIRTISPDLPVIMMTAYANAELLSQAEALGARAIVPKPLNIAQVIGLIEDSISQSSH